MMEVNQSNPGRSVMRWWIGVASCLLLGAVLVLGGLLVGGGSARPGLGSAGSPTAAAATQTAAADQPVTLLSPPASCDYCADNLVGKTAREIGQYAVQWSLYNTISYVITGTPQVLLVESITRDEVPVLVGGCLPGGIAVEEPPYALVILEGYFVSRRYSREAARFVTPFRYQILVFDLWAGQPTLWGGSMTGAEFRTLLNDPSLPVDPDPRPVPTCPTPVLARFPDGSPVHYGNTVPGCAGPCPTPSGVVQMPTRTPGTLPSPNPTVSGP